MVGLLIIIFIIAIIIVGAVMVANPSKKTTPISVPSVLPDTILNEIQSGRLPIINANKLYLKRGELCHFADHAIYAEQKKKRISQSSHYGHSMPGLLSGTTFYTGGAVSTSEDVFSYTNYKGSLYITNHRIIFNSSQSAFEKQLKDLSAIKPYTNAVELQFGQKLVTLYVPDGAVVYSVIQMLQ